MTTPSSPAADRTSEVRRRSASGPLRIGVLVSATGANLGTLLDLGRREPDSFEVCLVASHAEHVKALDLAREAGVEAWTGDFDARCGTASDAGGDPHLRHTYRTKARSWHNGLNARLAEWENRHGELDLIVLAYHRWIEGDLLDRFAGRMINQHPGDLSDLGPDGRRLLIGKDPVRLAMSLGRRSTRTSCFLVDGTRDGGAVVAMGPEVPVADRQPTVEDAWQQELLQKRLSDPFCLEWTVRAFSAGRLALSDAVHRDGSRAVLVDGAPTPLGGRRLTANSDLRV